MAAKLTRRVIMTSILAALAWPKQANAGTIQLRGKLFAKELEATSGEFFTDPTGDSEGIGLIASPGGWVHEWLKGSVNGQATITIEVTRDDSK